MNISPVSFTGNISKGREEFKKLSLIEQIVKCAAENSRRKYNETHIFSYLPQKSGDLADYVRYRCSIERIVKNQEKIKEIYGKARKKLGI